MDNARQALDALLTSLGESSQFAASGGVTPVLPGLEVKGAGSIGTPVTAAEAKRLIEIANQAPYGRGEETIVDTSVRRVWQIEPARFSLRNPAWSAHIDAIVDRVKQEFGINHTVAAKLYKLLVYEKGSFFTPHRDTEKTPGMFATLVVCLPSRHQGGTLIVQHDGQTKKIDFGGPDAEFKTHYAAFYADCEHQITPVTSGFRVCLVYNLAIVRTKRQPSAPRTADAVEKAAQLLEALFTDSASDLNRIVVPFTHKYSQAGFDPRQLKGADRSVADVLVRAAVALDYECYFALLTHHQSGEVDYDTWGYDRYRSRRSYSWGDDEEDSEEDSEANDSDSGAGMGEVFDEELSLEHWVDAQGRKQRLGKMHLESEEVLGLDKAADWFDHQEVSEATGNEGATLERWYHGGALVLWPRDRTFRILASEGQALALPELARRTSRAKTDEARAACRRLAEEIIRHWKPRQHSLEKSHSGRMLELLGKMGDVELVQRFVREVLTNDFDGSEGDILFKLCARFDWEPLAEPIRDFLSKQQPKSHLAQLAAIVAICEALCRTPPALTPERRTACAAIADELERVIERWDAAAVGDWFRREEKRSGVVASVVRIFAAIPATEHLESFVAHVLADRRRYDLHAVLIPDVKALAPSLSKLPAAKPAYDRLLEHCLSELRAATARPIEPPTDWSRPAELKCKCEDCRMLSRFLQDPEQKVGRFPLRKERRQHLHGQIDAHRCDCTHVTERRGSPQTLVCTKTQASYERRVNQFAVDTTLLAELEALNGGATSTAVTRAPKPRKPRKR